MWQGWWWLSWPYAGRYGVSQHYPEGPLLATDPLPPPPPPPPTASLGFLADYMPMDRKALAVYPILLFYFAISCLIIAQDRGFL